MQASRYYPNEGGRLDEKILSRYTLNAQVPVYETRTRVENIYAEKPYIFFVADVSYVRVFCIRCTKRKSITSEGKTIRCRFDHTTMCPYAAALTYCHSIHTRRTNSSPVAHGTTYVSSVFLK